MEISYGTEGILKGINNVIGSVTSDTVLVINGATTLRNVVAQYYDLNDHQIINQVAEEHALMYNTIANYPNIKIFFYVCKNMFNLVHPLHVRKISKNNIRITNILSDTFHDNGRTNVIMMENEFPHVVLKRELNKLRHLPCFMVSHFPVDFYLSDIFNAFAVINSFTGDIIPKQKLGEKVFGVKGCRLDRDLHVAFGDKELIRGIIKYRARLLNELKKRNRYFTHNQLMQQIKNNIGIPFSKIPFRIP